MLSAQAPVELRVMPGMIPGEVFAAWEMPAGTNTAAITDFAVQASLDNGLNWQAVDDGISTHPYVSVRGLDPSQSFVIRVAAVTGAGAGPWSAYSAVVSPSGAKYQLVGLQAEQQDLIRVAARSAAGVEALTEAFVPMIEAAQFTFGFKHVNETGADAYLIDSTGMRKYSEWQNPPITYWGPSANNAEGRLVYRFPFSSASQGVHLLAHSPSWDFFNEPGGSGRGVSLLEVSRDGTTWVRLRNSLEPRQWGDDWTYDDLLPESVLGSAELWVRMRFLAESAPNSSYTVAQFGRSTSSAASNVFELRATLAPNQRPTDFGLSATSIAENQPVGTTTGTFSTSDPAADDTFTYTLVAGEGSTDNASFVISGNSLQTAASFDFETKGSYSVRIRSTDQGGQAVEKVFTITVTNVNDAPTLSADASPALVPVAAVVATPVGGSTSGSTLVSDLIAAEVSPGNYSDPDDDLPGIAITGLNLQGGRLWFSVNGGASWQEVTDASDVSAVLLHADGLTRLFFSPASGFQGTIADAIAFRAWDRTGGYANGSTGINTQPLLGPAEGMISTGTWADVVTVSRDGRHAFVVDSSTGLVIVDISNPTNPVQVGAYKGSGNPRGVAVSADGRYAFFANGYVGLEVLDVRTPSNPTRVGGYNTTGYASFVTLSADGRYAYVADGNAGLRILDVTNPASPQDVGGIDTDDWARNVVLSADGNYAYVADWTAGLKIIDVSNPAQPVRVASFATAGYVDGLAISPDGRHLFAAVTSAGLQAIDVSNPAKPVAVGRSDTMYLARRVAVSADGVYAFVADSLGGLTLIDVRMPSAMAKLSHFDTTGSAEGVAVAPDGTHLFVADGNAGLTTLSFALNSASFSQTSDLVAAVAFFTNPTPTEVTLSATAIAENAGANAVVGTLSTTDADSDHTFTYALVMGEGSTDNASFVIVGDQLRTAASFDYETQSSYSIRVRSADQGGFFTETRFTITVTDIAEGPTMILLSNTAVPENAPNPTRVGRLSGARDGLFANLLSNGNSEEGSWIGTPSDGFPRFSTPGWESLNGQLVAERYPTTGRPNLLLTSPGPPDRGEFLFYGDNEPLSIARQIVDLAGSASLIDVGALDYVLSGWLGGFANQLDHGTVRVTFLDGDLQPVGFGQIGPVTASERNSISSLLYRETSAEVPRNARSAVVEIEMRRFAGIFNNGAADQLEFLLMPKPGLQQSYPDLSPQFQYSLVSGQGDEDNGRFAIEDGNWLVAQQAFDYEAQQLYSVRVRAVAANGLSYESAIEIRVFDINESPQDIIASSTSVLENLPSGALVAILSTTDPDADDAFTYTLVGGEGSTDNASFVIVDDHLRTAASFDYETQSSYSIRVRSTDQGGLFTDKTFTITASSLDSGAWLYWTNNGTLYRGLSDGSQQSVVISPSTPDKIISAFDIDSATGRIFYGEEARNINTVNNTRIYSAALDGTDRTLVYGGTGLGHVNFSMTVDSAAGYVFLHSHDPIPVSEYGPHYDGKIQRIEIATGEVAALPRTFWYVHDLQPSTMNGDLYLTGFSDFHIASSRLYRTDRNGSRFDEIPVAGIPAVNFALAETEEAIFISSAWGTIHQGRIYRLNLSNGTVASIHDGSAAIYDIEYDPMANSLYWYSASGITRSHADGTGVEVLYAYDTTPLMTDGHLAVVALPGVPAAVTGTSDNAEVRLTWSPPVSNGGAAITDYIVQYSSNDGGSWTSFSRSASPDTSATVTGLTNGTAYVFRVAAVNGAGTSGYSGISEPVTPLPPANTEIESRGSVLLTYDRLGRIYAGETPVTNGGSAIDYSAMNAAGWQAIAAEPIDGVNTLVWRHSSGNLHFWKLSESWTVMWSEGWQAPGSPEYFATETSFGMDFDNDGKVGSPFTVIESMGHATLAFDVDGRLYVGNTLVTLGQASVNYHSMNDAGWRAVAAEAMDGVNTLVWRHSSGNLHFWRLSDSWGQIRSDGWQAPGSSEFLATESILGMDFDADGAIGAAFTTIESMGAVDLGYDGAGQLYARGTLVTLGGKPVNYTAMTESGWQPLAAEPINGINTLVWRHASGKLHFWRLSEGWAVVSSDGWQGPRSPDYHATEIAFDMDFNGDGQIGTPRVTIESIGSTTLSRDSSGRLYATNSLITLGGKSVDFNTMTADGWRAVAAEAVNGINTLVWRHESGNLHFWRLSETWAHMSSDGWEAPGSRAARASERAFGMDLNGNGSADG